MQWFDASQIGVEGKGWADTDRPFDRFPLSAQNTVPLGVWLHSRKAAGLCFHFATDATAIHARWSIHGDPRPDHYLTGLAQCGLDFYARTEVRNWRWLASAGPTRRMEDELFNEVAVIEDLDKPNGLREFKVILPHAVSVKQVQIGVPEGAALEPIAPRTAKPMVYYGTSIAHGYHCSRPGSSHVNILARRLDVPLINLGFSGVGRMDASVVDLMAELEPRLYVLDCLPNMDTDMVRERCRPAVERLRARHPETPIVLIGGRHFANEYWRPNMAEQSTQKNAAQKQVFDALVAEGDRHLHYIPADGQLGADGEGTTDGSHPTDLGFWRYAEALEPGLRAALAGENRA